MRLKISASESDESISKVIFFSNIGTISHTYAGSFPPEFLVQFIYTFSSSALIDSATEPGAAARAAEERKRRRYADLAQRYRFVPLAVETSGVLGPACADFLQELGHRISACTGDPRESAWIRQRISLAIARGNALAILHSSRRD